SSGASRLGGESLRLIISQLLPGFARLPLPRVRTSVQAPLSFSPSSTRSTWLSSNLPFTRQLPASHSITVPPPYSPFGITPSKLPYSIGWSSTSTASRFSPGSRLGPLGRAQLFSTPSCSSRRSKWSWLAACLCMMYSRPPGAVPGVPDGSGVRAKSRLRRYSASGARPDALGSAMRGTLAPRACRLDEQGREGSAGRRTCAFRPGGLPDAAALPHGHGSEPPGRPSRGLSVHWRT